jgi:tetratricopeptide (TPR) repeat protein
MDLQTLRLRLYRTSYSCHKFIAANGWLWLVWILGAAAVLWGRVAPWAAGAWVVVWLLLAAACAWFSTRFRYVAWWMANHWRISVLVLAAVSAATWARPFVAAAVRRMWVPVTGEFLLRAAAALALLGLLYWGWQAHQRIFIRAFNNYTGDDKLKSCIEGLAPRLLNHLGLLRELYVRVDETQPVGSGGGAVSSATVSLQDIGQVLQGAVSAESKVKLGFLEIPVGAMLGALGKIVQGPSISASVHLEGNKLLILARIDGGGWQGKTWRVHLDDLASPELDGTMAIGKLTEQLSHRIFTDLVPSGSPRWQAVRCYTEGLRLLSLTSQTRTGKRANLRMAEQSFIHGLSADNKFARSAYNLGVTYTNLGESDSARSAYLEAVRIDPGLSSGYYALALNHWNAGDAATGRVKPYWRRRDYVPKLTKEESAEFAKQDRLALRKYADTIRCCRQVIALQPADARAWDLMGFAERRLKEHELAVSLDDADAADATAALRQTMMDRGIATALAWRSLCKAALLRRPIGPARDTAVRSILNLAVGEVVLGSARSERLYRQGLCLAPQNPDLYFELAKRYQTIGRFKPAVRCHRAALAIEDRPVFWAYLAETQGRWHQQLTAGKKPAGDHKQAALEACLRALDFRSDDRGIRERVAIAYEKVGEPALSTEVRDEIPKLYAALNQRNGEDTDAYLARLWKEAKAHRRWAWAYARFLFQIATTLLSPAQPDEKRVPRARKMIESAIRRMEAEHPREIRDLGMYGWLARAYSSTKSASPLQDNLDKALLNAERAVAMHPERAFERQMLGDVHWALKDYSAAEAEYMTGFNLDPTNYRLWMSIAHTYWNRGVSYRDRASRTAAFTHVIEFFNRALSLLESNTLDAASLQDQWPARGHMRYWLGRFHLELMHYDQAITYLSLSRGMNFKPVEAAVDLGTLYVEVKAYDEAEKIFQETIATIRAQLKQAPKSGAARKGSLLAAKANAAGEDTPMSELLARTYLRLSTSYAERGVKLDRARSLAGYVNWLLPQLDASKVDAFRSECHDCLGVIALKSGKLDDATREFQDSIAASSSGENYCHLAQVWLARARAALTAADEPLVKLRECCSRASEADLRGRLTGDIADLLRHADALAPRPKP